MQAQNAERRWTSMKVEKVTAAEDRQGRPQWELSVRWEWTPASNQWGERIWVYQQICPSVINMGAHNVLVERGTVKTNRDGVAYDGSYDWMWHWKLTEWEGKGDTANMADDISPQLAAETPAPAPAPAPAPSTPSTIQPLKGMDDRGLSIIRQVAFKAAVDVAILSLQPDTSDPTILEDYVSRRTDTFMSIILGTHAPIEDGFDESRHSGEIDEEF